MNAITPVAAPPVNANPLIPTSMEGAMRLAEMMARGKLVPSHFHGQPGDCLLVIEQAMRWGMSPFAVAQSTSVVQGKLMFEGKLVIAAINASGILVARLRETFHGEGASRSVTITGTIRGEDAPRDITIKLADAKTSNNMWVKQPDQQLIYFAARAWARRHVPEIMLGVYSPEEWPEQQRAQPFAGDTIDGTAEPPPAEPAKPVRTWGMILAEIEADFDAATDYVRVDEIIASDMVQHAMDKATGKARDKLNSIVQAALARHPDPRTDPAMPDDDDVFPGDRP